MRQLLAQDPFRHLPINDFWYTRGVWPCSWISGPATLLPPFVSAYRCRFTLDYAATIRIHVSADERYELFLDGDRVGRGPERGEPRHWRFETYDLPLLAGNHVLVARVWSRIDPASVVAPSAAWVMVRPSDQVDQLSSRYSLL